MSLYEKDFCPKYSVTVRNKFIADFIVNDGEEFFEHTINLKEKGGDTKNKYFFCKLGRHFFSHEDGEIIYTPCVYNNLLLIEKYPENKIFYQARQWELDWWMSVHFPNSVNAKIFEKIKSILTKND
jgi:hypothetical protein